MGTLSPNYDFIMPDPEDEVLIEDLNANTLKIDETLHDSLSDFEYRIEQAEAGTGVVYPSANSFTYDSTEPSPVNVSPLRIGYLPSSGGSTTPLYLNPADIGGLGTYVWTIDPINKIVSATFTSLLFPASLNTSTHRFTFLELDLSRRVPNLAGVEYRWLKPPNRGTPVYATGEMVVSTTSTQDDRAYRITAEYSDFSDTNAVKFLVSFVGSGASGTNPSGYTERHSNFKATFSAATKIAVDMRIQYSVETEIV